jgi:uncharacterized membrane protein
VLSADASLYRDAKLTYGTPAGHQDEVLEANTVGECLRIPHHDRACPCPLSQRTTASFVLPVRAGKPRRLGHVERESVNTPTGISPRGALATRARITVQRHPDGRAETDANAGRFETMIPSPSEIGVEEIIVNVVLWLKLLIEAIGALVIGVGMILAGLRFTRGSFPPMARDFIDVCLILARFLAIALEFQLGADILSTAVAPSWDAIGKLAAIAVIRTALNYVLSRDMQEERGVAVTSQEPGYHHFVLT